MASWHLAVQVGDRKSEYYALPLPSRDFGPLESFTRGARINCILGLCWSETDGCFVFCVERDDGQGAIPGAARSINIFTSPKQQRARAIPISGISWRRNSAS